MNDNQPPDNLNAAKILVAEDNPAVREFVSRALVSAGYRVVEAIDGQQALDILFHGPVDVLVADIVMPNVDGIALAMKATSMYPELKVVMISGYAQERMRAHNLDTLVHKIIAKPFSIEELCLSVKNALPEKFVV